MPSRNRQLLNIMLTIFQNELDSSGFAALQEHHAALRGFSPGEVERFLRAMRNRRERRATRPRRK